jgi:uncharacterized protein
MSEDYQVGKPVSGTAFIGREKEARQLADLLKSGQSVVLIAPRRFGKTSLILRVMEILRDEHCDTGYIDIFTTPDIKRLSEIFIAKILENRKLEKIIVLAKKNIAELFRNIEFKSTIEDFEVVLKFGQPNTDPWELLEESIDFAEKYAKKYSVRLIVGLDEFGDIDKLGGSELAKLLRAKMQIQKNVNYIFSGSYESVMNQLFTTAKSPFYRFARIVQLGYIETNAFKQLYLQKLKNAGLLANHPLIDKILSFTQGHPYYSALFLQQWLLLGNSIAENPQQAFALLTENILSIEKAYIEKLWEDVSSSREQRNLILALMESRKPYTVVDVKRINVSRTIATLTNKGLVMKRKEGYYLTDPIFEMWLRHEVLKES